ncbi:MAG: hypothetical protein Q9173_005663 [Seirophora scorigena]
MDTLVKVEKVLESSAGGSPDWHIAIHKGYRGKMEDGCLLNVSGQVLWELAGKEPAREDADLRGLIVMSKDTNVKPSRLIETQPPVLLPTPALLFPDPEDQTSYFSGILDDLSFPVRSLESPPV